MVLVNTRVQIKRFKSKGRDEDYVYVICTVKLFIFTGVDRVSIILVELQRVYRISDLSLKKPSLPVSTGKVDLHFILSLEIQSIVRRKKSTVPFPI